MKTVVLSISMVVAAAAGTTPAAAQTETLIHTFQSTSHYDGANPNGSLVPIGKGGFYGTTIAGGKNNYGTVFKLSPPTARGALWKQDILYSFSGSDGQFPSGSLLIDAKSRFIYGTTEYTSSSYGAVYELIPPSQAGNPWAEKLLHSFTGGVDGGEPGAGVISDSLGRLYGTTPLGGKQKCGVVFRLTPPSKSGGEWTEEALYNFTCGSDGTSPESGLIMDNAGNLYGTTVAGGVNCAPGGCGTVYELTPPSGGKGIWIESVLYAFAGGSDGGGPYAGLIFDSAGALYGTTADGGDLTCNSGYGCGTVFKLRPAEHGGIWTETVVYAFTSGSDGFYPQTGVTLDGAGALYGTTTYGGGAACVNDGCGTAFKLTPPAGGIGAWTETILHAFAGGTDGSFPGAPLLLVGTSLYGTTYEGTGNCLGGGGCGTVFEIVP